MKVFVKILVTLIFSLLCLILVGIFKDLASPRFSGFAGLFFVFGLYGIYCGVWKKKKQSYVETANKDDSQSKSLQE